MSAVSGLDRIPSMLPVCTWQAPLKDTVHLSHSGEGSVGHRSSKILIARISLHHISFEAFSNISSTSSLDFRSTSSLGTKVVVLWVDDPRHASCSTVVGCCVPFG